jgi:hypothetical protein
VDVAFEHDVKPLAGSSATGRVLVADGTIISVQIFVFAGSEIICFRSSSYILGTHNLKYLNVENKDIALRLTIVRD